MAVTYKALPYGISNFRRIREENYYFVDKSSYIPVLEDAAISGSRWMLTVEAGDLRLSKVED